MKTTQSILSPCMIQTFLMSVSVYEVLLMLRACMLSVIMLSVVMLSVIMLSVVMLIVVVL